MSSRQKKRYNRRKSAVKAYFTTDANLDEIAFRHHLSAAVLLKLVEKCLMQHEDGILWGFRALLPGIKVIDHAPRPAPEEGVDPDKEGSEATIEELPVADEAGVPVEDEQPGWVSPTLPSGQNRMAQRMDRYANRCSKTAGSGDCP